MWRGQNDPLAPSSAVNPSTYPQGSNRPFSTDSYGKMEIISNVKTSTIVKAVENT